MSDCSESLTEVEFSGHFMILGGLCSVLGHRLDSLFSRKANVT